MSRGIKNFFPVWLLVTLSALFLPMQAFGAEETPPQTDQIEKTDKVDKTDNTPKYPVLILDVLKDPKFPAHLRSSLTRFPADIKKPPSRIGLNQLNISGSAQFTGKNITQMMKKLNFYQGYIIDLRQESHGFINNTPISWFGIDNGANKNRSPNDISNTEKKLLTNLQKLGNTVIYTHLIGKDDTSSFFPQEMHFQSAVGEDKIVTHNGLQYQRFYIQDHHAPTASEIDRFLTFVKSLPENTALHFHCETGVGRTTTFMVLYDMLKNADKVSQEDILKRQYLIGGEDLTDVTSQSEWKNNQRQKRLEIISEFYQYVRSPDGYAVKSFTDWLKAKNKYEEEVFVKGGGDGLEPEKKPKPKPRPRPRYRPDYYPGYNSGYF